MMKKGLLAVAALTGAALTTNAALLKVSDQTFANFGLKMQIYGQVIDDAANQGQDKAIDFTIQNARVYFSGQLNPIVQFGANLDFAVTGLESSHEGTKTTKVRDAFINFHFMDGFNVMAGYYRLPFSRNTLVDRYNTIFMAQDGWLFGGYKNQVGPTINIGAPNNILGYIRLTTNNVLGGPSLGNALALAEDNALIIGGVDDNGNVIPDTEEVSLGDDADASRDAGITIWGDINAGNALAIKYYLGIYDGFGDHNVGEVLVGNTSKDNLNYVARIQFTPTVWGFQPENGYLMKETYLGKKNVLTFGFGYSASKLDLNAGQGTSFTFKSWTIDANWEQKLVLGNMPLVPKVEFAYVNTDGDDLPLSCDNGDTANLNEVSSWYLKVGTLFDTVIGLGKMGVYVKYQKVNVDLKNDENNNLLKDFNPTIWTIAIPYYLADQNAKVVFQWNYYDYDKQNLDPRGGQNEDSNSDITLAFQVQF